MRRNVRWVCLAASLGLLLLGACARAPLMPNGLQFADSLSSVTEGGKVIVTSNPRGIVTGTSGSSSGTQVTTDSSYTGWPFNVQGGAAAASSQEISNGFPAYVFGNSNTASYFPGVVKQLYRSFVAIEPATDPSQPNFQSVAFFIRQLVAGRPWTQLMVDFLTSPYAKSFGNVSQMNDLNFLYRSDVGHVGDIEAMFTEIGAMGSGTTLLQEAQNIDNSQEHQNLNGVYYIAPTVEMFRAFLARMPINQDEMVYVMKLMIKNGTSFSSFIGTLRGLDEWKQKGGYNMENINALYRTITGDVAPAAALAQLVQTAASGGVDTTKLDDPTGSYNTFLQYVASNLIKQVSGNSQ